MIGSSSRDIRLSKTVTMVSQETLPFRADSNTTMGDIMDNEKARPHIQPLIDDYVKAMNLDGDMTELGEATKLMMEAQLRDNPLRVMVSFTDGRFTHEDIARICNEINGEFSK